MRLPFAVVLLVAAAAPVAAQDTTTTPPPAAQPQAAGQVTIEAVLARTVVDRAPQDTGTAFPDSVGTIALWMKVSGASGQTLHHVWFHGDDQVGDVSLAIGGSPWRTWSRKQIPADATGAWRVEIRDETGNVLRKLDFTVGQ